MAALPELQFPESRVLIIITGGTICMKRSPDGLVPVGISFVHLLSGRKSHCPLRGVLPTSHLRLIALSLRIS